MSVMTCHKIESHLLSWLGLTLLACSLLSCSTLEPRPIQAWREPVHPLYAPVVGVITDEQYIGNGVIIHSTKARGTYILTVDHVIQPAPQHVRVLVFKHSHRPAHSRTARPQPPSFHYIDARPLIREWYTTHAFATALDDLIILLEVIWGQEEIDYPTITPSQYEAYQTLKSIVDQLKHPPNEARFASQLEAFKTTVKKLNMTSQEANALSAAMAEVMGSERTEALFDDLLVRINSWAETSTRLMGQGRAVTEFAILQLNTEAFPTTFHHAVSCASNSIFQQPGRQLTYASIYPKREPNTGQLVTEEGYRVAGKLKAGQSGSPVFYQQYLVGLIARKARRNTGYLMPLQTIQAALHQTGFEWMLSTVPSTTDCPGATQVKSVPSKPEANPTLMKQPALIHAQFWPGAQTSAPTSWSKRQLADTIN